jgi:hypothetical protein
MKQRDTISSRESDSQKPGRIQRVCAWICNLNWFLQLPFTIGAFFISALLVASVMSAAMWAVGYSDAGQSDAFFVVAAVASLIVWLVMIFVVASAAVSGEEACDPNDGDEQLN